MATEWIVEFSYQWPGDDEFQIIRYSSVVCKGESHSQAIIEFNQMQTDAFENKDRCPVRYCISIDVVRPYRPDSMEW